MFRIQANLLKDNHIMKHTVIKDGSEKTRTQKVLEALNKACYEFDLQVPAWFDYNIKQFKDFNRVRFNSDNFIEDFPYDYLELTMLNED